MSFTDPADYFLGQKTTAEGTFMPPVNSIDLMPEVYREFQCRFGDFSVNAAEFFHENSKVIRGSTRQISQNQESIDEVIEHYINTSYNFSPETIDNINDTPILPAFQWHQEVPECLHGLGINNYRRFYAIDAYVLTGNKLRKVLPNKQILVKDRVFDETKINKLHAAFYGPNAAAGQQYESFVFLVGCPWRYMMLFGVKGYRRMLMDLGAILADFDTEINSGALSQLEYFYDNEIDRFLDLDGIEQSIQCVLGTSKVKLNGNTVNINGSNGHE